MTEQSTMNIAEILKNLPDNLRKQIMYAFEHHIEQYIELENDIFIGVNITNVPHLLISQSVGAWSVGTIIRSTNG